MGVGLWRKHLPGVELVLFPSILAQRQLEEIPAVDGGPESIQKRHVPYRQVAKAAQGCRRSARFLGGDSGRERSERGEAGEYGQPQPPVSA